MYFLLFLFTVTFSVCQLESNQIHIYSKSDYKLNAQNFVIKQSDRGHIFVANQGGLLIYNGISWRTIDIPNHSVLSLDIDKNKNVYIGGYNEFGFFRNGKYSSLSELLPDSISSFSEIWDVYSVDSIRYFVAEKTIFVYKVLTNKQHSFLRIIKFSNTINRSSKYQNLLMVFQKNNPLDKNKDSEIHSYSQNNNSHIRSHLLINDTIHFICNDYRILNKNLKKVRVLKHIKDKVKSSLYLFKELNNSLYAFITYSGSCIITDQNFKIKYYIDNKSQLNNTIIYNAFLDKEGNLWLALSNGIAKTNIYMNFKIYTQSDGIAGNPISLESHLGELYIGTDQGLYKMQKGTIFSKIHKIESAVWNIISSSKKLFISSSNGLYSVKGDIFKKYTNDKSYKVIYSNTTKQYILAGSKGLYLFKEDTRPKLVYQSPTAIIDIIEDKEHQFLALQKNHTILKLNASFKKTASWKNPFNTEFRLKYFKQHTHLLSNKGVYYISKDEIIPDTCGYFQSINMKQLSVFSLYFSGKAKDIIINSNGKLLDPINNNRLEIPDDIIAYSYKKFREQLFIASSDGLITYFPKPENLSKKFNSYINLVFGKDQYRYKKHDLIPYDHKTLRFTFYSDSFLNEKRNLYRSKLLNFNDSWSDWTKLNIREYTQLSPGKYEFLVQAQNALGKYSPVSSYSFIIKTPWYRETLFYICLGLTFSLLLLLIYQNQIKRIRKKYIKELRRKQEKMRQVFLKEEINSAKALYERLMPENTFSNEHFDVDAMCLPAHNLGGDHFFWQQTGKNDLFLALIDVEGKRMEGAFPAVFVNGLIKGILKKTKEIDLESIAYNLNQEILNNLKQRTSVAMLLATIHKNSFNYINAGNPSPILIKNKELIKLQQKNNDFRPAMGILDLNDYGLSFYKKQSVNLSQNDGILLFSDGFYENMVTHYEETKNQIMNVINLGKNNMIREMHSMFKNADLDIRDDLSLIFIRKKVLYDNELNASSTVSYS